MLLEILTLISEHMAPVSSMLLAKVFQRMEKALRNSDTLYYPIYHSHVANGPVICTTYMEVPYNFIQNPGNTSVMFVYVFKKQSMSRSILIYIEALL